MNEIAAAPLAAVATQSSVGAMFLNAGIAGKLGMIGVLAASIVCWAIIIQKLVLRRARKPGDERSSSSWPE